MRLYKRCVFFFGFFFLVSVPTLLVSALTVLKLLLEHILSRICLTLDPMSYAQLIFVGDRKSYENRKGWLAIIPPPISFLKGQTNVFHTLLEH